LCDLILTGQGQHVEAILAIDAWLLDQSEPEIFDSGDSRNILDDAKRKFLSVCAALAVSGFPQPARLTLVEFHGAIEHLLKKQQAE
jgi:hypothetical protein